MKDLVIIGGGPAGLSAAIYAQRYKLDAVLVAQEIGGTANEAHLVENYPGFPSLKGFELMNNFKKHAEGLGAKLIMDSVKRIEKIGDSFKVECENNEFEAKNVLLATGTKRRKLNVQGEEEFLGRGVSYCATCDAPFYNDKVVAVIGGNDAAAQAAIVLSEHAKKVYIIYRKYKVRCEPRWYDKITADPKIEIINESIVTKILGDTVVKSVEINNEKNLAVDGVFIEIGSVPSIALLDGLGVEFDEHNYIKVSPAMETSVKGLYAAGDNTTGSNHFMQIVTAVSEGAQATHSVFENLDKK